MTRAAGGRYRLLVSPGYSQVSPGGRCRGIAIRVTVIHLATTGYTDRGRGDHVQNIKFGSGGTITMGKFSDALSAAAADAKQKKDSLAKAEQSLAEKIKEAFQRSADWLNSTFVPAIKEANADLSGVELSHGIKLDGANPLLQFQLHSKLHNGPKYGVMVLDGVDIRVYKDGQNDSTLGTTQNCGRKEVDRAGPGILDRAISGISA
jgi:hypothetical protein